MANIKLIRKGEAKSSAHEAFSPATVQIGGKTWMVENLSVDDGGDGIYLDEATGEYYYTYDAAQRIADATPGWHLPKDEEWKAAAEESGAYQDSTADSPYTNDYRDAGGLKSKLRVKLVGHFVDRLRSVGDLVYFWTASRYNPSEMCIRTFATGTDMGFWHARKADGNSVRLVKD